MFIVVHCVVIMLMMMLEGVQTVGAERSLENLAPVLLRQSIKVGQHRSLRIAGYCRRPTVGGHFRQWRQRNLVIAFKAHAAAVRLKVIRFTSLTSKAL